LTLAARFTKVDFVDATHVVVNGGAILVAGGLVFAFGAGMG
jgi:hypothetical protein